jgi:DNA-directed RNA polymerase subunit beta'
VGLKENVILGHLIPAGTGFRIFQDSEVNFNREALAAAAESPISALEESFPLLAGGPAAASAPSEADEPHPAPRGSGSEALDAMFGSDE